MDLNDINSALIEKDLPRLERHFFMRYKGQVPDYDNYNETLDRLFRMLSSGGKTIVYNEETGKYAKHKSINISGMKFKANLLDAILTIKHYNRLEKEKAVSNSSSYEFDLVQQLMEVA